VADGYGVLNGYYSDVIERMLSCLFLWLPDINDGAPEYALLVGEICLLMTVILKSRDPNF
jgi:hypothetical protein